MIERRRQPRFVQTVGGFAIVGLASFAAVTAQPLPSAQAPADAQTPVVVLRAMPWGEARAPIAIAIEKHTGADKEAAQARLNYRAAAETSRRVREAIEKSMVGSPDECRIATVKAKTTAKSMAARHWSRAIAQVKVNRMAHETDAPRAIRAILQEHDRRYCSMQAAARGSCIRNIRLAMDDADLDASTLFESNAGVTHSADEYRASLLYMDLVTNPAPNAVVSAGLERTPAGRKHLAEMRRTAALSSLALNSYSNIVASRRPATFQPADPGAVPELEPLTREVALAGPDLTRPTPGAYNAGVTDAGLPQFGAGAGAGGLANLSPYLVANSVGSQVRALAATAIREASALLGRSSGWVGGRINLSDARVTSYLSGAIAGIAPITNRYADQLDAAGGQPAPGVVQEAAGLIAQYVRQVIDTAAMMSGPPPPDAGALQP